MVHDFGAKLREGQRYERVLDKFFRRWYDIHYASRDMQRVGVDRVWCRPDGSILWVEYKADTKAAETGNAFVETVSVDVAGKPGWSRVSRAELLVYFVPPLRRAYLMKMDRLMRAAEEWGRAYPVGEAQNKGYKTKGVLVPLEEFGRVASKVMTRVG